MITVALLAFLGRPRRSGTTGAGVTLLPPPPPGFLGPQHVLVHELFSPFLHKAIGDGKKQKDDKQPSLDPRSGLDVYLRAYL